MLGVTFLFYSSFVNSICPTGEIQVGPNDGNLFVPSNQYFGCGGISKVTVLDGINRIGSYAFAQCGSLSSVIFPTSLRIIETHSFISCSSLSSVSFPEGLIEIGPAAFQTCNLNSVYLSSTIRVIGHLVFQSNYNLNQITDSGSPNCYSFRGVMIVINNSLVFCSGYVADVEFPPNVDSIGTHAFCYCDRITSIFIPSQIVFIGVRAFYGCRLLQTAEIGSGLADFSKDLFEECLQLTSITVAPDNPMCESKDNILYTKGLKTMILYPVGLANTNLEILAETTDFEPFCFSGAANLRSFSVPAGHPAFLSEGGVIYSLDKTVLYKIPPGLTSFTLLEDVKTFYQGACVRCLFLSFVFPPKTEYVGDFSFRDALITSITIPKTVKYLGRKAFELTKLQTVTFQDGIQLGALKAGVFGNTKIASISLPESVLLIERECFRFANVLSRVELPSNLRAIEAEAFFGCTQLAGIVFPESLEYIGENGFANCISILEIRIPFKTREIGRYGFGLCTGIKTAVLENCGTKYYEDTFEGILNLSKICIATRQFTRKTNLKTQHKLRSILLFSIHHLVITV